MVDKTRTVQTTPEVKARRQDGVIRPMVELDLDVVMSIEEKIYTMPWKRPMFLSELKNNPYSNLFTVLDQDKEEVIGYVCFWIIMDELHLLNLSIHPVHQRKGVGSQLAAWVIQQGRERAVRRASLEVRASNIPAIGLYKKMGFKVVAVRPGYYRDPREDGLIMVLEE